MGTIIYLSFLVATIVTVYCHFFSTLICKAEMCFLNHKRVKPLYTQYLHLYLSREEIRNWEVFFSFFKILPLHAREFEQILWANVSNFLSIYDVPLPHYYLSWAYCELLTCFWSIQKCNLVHNCW